MYSISFTIYCHNNWHIINFRVAAVVSAAGATGGSPLANDATQSQLELMGHWPKAQ